MPVVNPGGGGAGGGAVTIADGADVAQGSTADALGANTVIGQLKKIAAAGGSAVSIADGSDVAEGATTDAAVVSDVAGTVSGKLRGLVKIFADVWDSVNHRLNVTVGNFPATQPISAVALPLPSGAAQDSSLTTLDTDLKATQPRDVTDRVARLLGHVNVDNFPASQPVSAVSLPLPAGAALESGNLATLVTQTRNDAQILDVLNLILAQLRLLNLNFASNSPSSYVDPDGYTVDTFSN